MQHENSKRSFVVWSGSYARVIAEHFVNLLQRILPDWEHFVSPRLTGGDDWHRALDEHFLKSSVAFLIVTNANSLTPWMAFEAGVFHLRALMSDPSQPNGSSFLGVYPLTPEAKAPVGSPGTELEFAL